MERPEAVIGVVSLILWSLILIVSVKYAILILRADNRGSILGRGEPVTAIGTERHTTAPSPR